MRRLRHRLLSVVLACAGCSRERQVASPIDVSTTPQRGGTLRILQFGDVDHLATTSAYNNASLSLNTLTSRTLLTYPPVADNAVKIQPVPDLARLTPTRENGGISADGLTYTFHLRGDIRWDTNPVRLFVAGDVVRAFKLACNPSQPASATGFFIDAIEGFGEFCVAFGTVAPTVSAMRQFVDTSTLHSVRALDDSTLIVRLRAPRPDFLNVAALPYLAPVPREYLDYIPDGPEFRQHTISIGPYRLRRYLPNREFVYERNPVWTAASDPLRPAYVDRVIVTLGVDLQLQMLQIEAGTADLSPDPVRGADVGPMLASGNPVLWLSPTGPGGGSMSFLAINRVGPDRDAVLGKLEVRRALALAVDKAALVQVSAGPQVASPLRQAAPSFLAGHRPSDREYATPGDRGDASAARAMLQRAGYPPDRPLRIAYPIGTDAVAQVLQASFAKAGLRVELKPLLTGEYYGRLLSDIGNARRGEWDLAVVSWYPDWYGKSNGRTVLPTLFDGRTVGKNVTNYGGFSADSVNLAIDRAANAVDTPTADSLWHEMSLLLSREVALIPLLETKYPWPRSRRVRGCTWDSYSLGCNLTNLWLARPPMGEAAR